MALLHAPDKIPYCGIWFRTRTRVAFEPGNGTETRHSARGRGGGGMAGIEWGKWVHDRMDEMEMSG